MKTAEDQPDDHQGSTSRDIDTDIAFSTVEKALENLSEFFDTTQFVGTIVEADGNTRVLKIGRGNWYARKASVEELYMGMTQAMNQTEEGE